MFYAWWWPYWVETYSAETLPHSIAFHKFQEASQNVNSTLVRKRRRFVVQPCNVFTCCNTLPLVQLAARRTQTGVGLLGYSTMRWKWFGHGHRHRRLWHLAAHNRSATRSPRERLRRTDHCPSQSPRITRADQPPGIRYHEKLQPSEQTTDQETDVSGPTCDYFTCFWSYNNNNTESLWKRRKRYRINCVTGLPTDLELNLHRQLF
jgi:hypothetical protein